MRERKKSLFDIPGYAAWFVADTSLLAASAAHAFAISLVAYALSGSVMLAGCFVTARSLVTLVTQALGGVIIDRHDHKLLVVAQAASSAVIWLAMGLLFLRGQLSFWAFAGLCLLSSGIYGLLGGTTNAALVSIVGPEHYAHAESVNQGRDAVTGIAGGVLGAVLYNIAASLPFFATAGFDALGLVAALRMRLPRREGRAAGSEGSFVGEMATGWRWMFSNRRVLVLAALVGVANFCQTGVSEAINLHLVGNETDPLLIAVPQLLVGVSMMVGSRVSVRLVDRIPVGKGLPALLAAMAASYACVPILGGSYESMMLTSALMGIPMTLFSSLVMGYLFSRVPVTLQGRARAALTTSVQLLSSLCGALCGSLLGYVGIAGLVLGFAVVACVGVLAAAANPHVRAIPAAPQWGTDEVSVHGD